MEAKAANPRNIHPLLKKLLTQIGITGDEEIIDFLNPDYDEHTHDPYLLPDMEKAVLRILEAVCSGERVIIYPDYDADGIPGAVVLNDLFKQIGFENFEIYIPHRHEEGFGLNKNAVEGFAEQKVSLIITIDCGSSDKESIDLANSLGIDVVVTDHHIPKDPEPDAYALVNPKRRSSEYPFKELCGAAVAFKLVQALIQKINLTPNTYHLKPIRNGWEKWLLDMVGIATLSDMVPLVGENRVLAKYGLLVLRKSKRPGIKVLCRRLKLKQGHLSEDDIGFMITPRINAASRMDEPMDAFKLLSAESYEEAEEFFSHLDHINNERKGKVASMVKEIRKRLGKLKDEKDVVVVGDPRWRTGLVGLAAQKISEEYNKPVFVWGREGGDVIRGSARSPGSYNVVEIMKGCAEFLTEYGGHSFAGGFSVSHENIHTLEEKILNSYNNLEDFSKKVPEEDSLSEELSLIDINWEVWDLVESLAPFGEANPKPRFLFKNSLIKEVKLFGKEGNHTNIIFEKPSGGVVEAISFFSVPEDFKIVPKAELKVDLLATIEKSVFRGRPELRLRIVDIY